MKLEFEVSLNYVEVLSKWASVSRTLNEAQGLLTDNASDLDEVTRERVFACAGELRQLEPALNHLHKQAQSAIWQLKRS